MDDPNDQTAADQLSGDNGAIYTANQTPYDVADEGLVTQNNGVTTVSNPSWLDNLLGVANSVAGVAATAVPVVQNLSGKTTKPPTVTTDANNPNPVFSSLKSSSPALLIGVGLAAIVGLFLILRRK